jgi:hypothetical protein
MRMRVAFLGGVALCAAGASMAQAADTAPTDDWRPVATPADVTRLHAWRDAFVKGLAEVRAGGFDAELAKEGSLLEPDAAIDGAALPAGSYRCRTIKLGSQGDGGLAFVAYPAFDCRVTAEGAVFRFVRLNGSQRPTGVLYRPSVREQVFLGTLVLGDETRALSYGRDTDRNMAGAVQRIGPNRWRLVLPYPRFESTLDVMELVPAS